MKIGVVGIGKLGLCFALNLSRAGYKVIGVDVSEEYVKSINNRSLFSYEPKVNELLQNNTNLFATTDISEIIEDDVELIFIMVATPSLADGSYDHQQIERVAAQFIEHGKRYKRVNVVIGCTVMPGYTDSLQNILGVYNYDVSYNPEFIAQGNIIEDQLNPDQILIGEASKEAGDIIESVYKRFCVSNPAICRMSRISAEICKIATNCFLTTKISFANSVGDLAVKVGAEPDKILAAIGADSRIGGSYLQYGFGFGGPCFPRDNRALNLFARNSGFNLFISEATDNVNQQHLNFQFEQYIQQYKDDEIIVFDGVAYKKGTVILDESQSLALAIKLAKAGRKVMIREREVVINALRNLYGDIFLYEYNETT
jgi:nucleotide sugar dehydrogenase